jgi:hypothetical protein
MKTMIILLMFALMASCTSAIIEPQELIDGVWSGWIITADSMIFRTNVGVKTINYPIKIIKHNERWFIWENGYDMEIYYEGENK